MFDIVIVEDEQLERMALQRIVDQNIDNARVVGVARNGAEAVELIETTPIDLMLVDIKIPRPNGLELIQMIRGKGLNTKIIILTAYDHFDIMKEAIHLKADNFLLKPIRTQDLLRAVSECLEQATPAPVKSDETIAGRIAGLVDQDDYRGCLDLARESLRDLFTQEGVVLRRGAREYVDALLALLEARELEVSSGLEKCLAQFDAKSVDANSHFQVQELTYRIVDVLFEVTDDRGARGSDHIEHVLNYIQRNLHRFVSLEDAADFARISPFYLSRLFHKETGTTFVAYVKDRRIEQAKELLIRSKLPIGNVALDLSFSDANYFCKAFKKEVGISPSEYRRRNGGEVSQRQLPAASVY